MEVVSFKAEHLMNIDLQEGQAYLSGFITPEQAQALEEEDWSYTGMIGDTPIACAGILPMWQGRGLAWAYISCNAAKQNFVAVHKSISRALQACYLQRIEMTVDCEFEPGHRWARLLGFELEAERMKAYRPDGGDCSLYARVIGDRL